MHMVELIVNGDMKSIDEKSYFSPIAVHGCVVVKQFVYAFVNYDVKGKSFLTTNRHYEVSLVLLSITLIMG